MSVGAGAVVLAGRILFSVFFARSAWGHFQEAVRNDWVRGIGTDATPIPGGMAIGRMARGGDRCS